MEKPPERYVYVLNAIKNGDNHTMQTTVVVDLLTFIIALLLTWPFVKWLDRTTWTIAFGRTLALTIGNAMADAFLMKIITGIGFLMFWRLAVEKVYYKWRNSEFQSRRETSTSELVSDDLE